ncbi:hypothetical protein NG895_04360 [Aeoliella sp. ICT_H6.2]|uniref:Uncharacterized protein n=1 Tax=Aeoliella straminimaris TaxID=2954799 RepID=A0A9X2FB68_9BACT|nr:hypothetical protein [Aeoliella straminimaris]MCO6043129.1 hypothetical protein [Aeoliella straminimaris]
MQKIYKVGRRYFDSALQGDAESLRSLFEHRARLWSDPSYEREIPPSWLFNDFACKFQSQRAFQLVPVAVEIALQQETASDFECGLWLIWRLAECSGTTELPISLQKKLPALQRKRELYVNSDSTAFGEILRHYRLQPAVFEFLEPWHPCSDACFEDELRRELCVGHVLHGLDAIVVARRHDMDDFLFELSDGRFANVHLTWSSESNPAWPSTEIYDSRLAMEIEIQRQIDEWKQLGPADQ